MSFFPAGQGFLAGLAGTVNGNLTVTGRVLVADGTAAAPSITFATETNTGFYRNGAQNLGASVGGVNRAGFQTGEYVTDVGLRTINRLAVDQESIKTADYPATSSDAVVIMDNTALTLTLPASPGNSQMLFVRNNNAGTLTIARNGQNINGAAANLTVLAATGLVLSFTSGVGWYVVG